MIPQKWKIITFSTEGRKEHWYNGNPEKVAEKIKEMNDLPGVKAHLVSRIHAYRPRGVGERGQLWCPYCRRWRWFSRKELSLDRVGYVSVVCQWCHISDDDYYVKKFNHLWFVRRTRKKRRKPRRQLTRSTEVIYDDDDGD